MKGSGGTEGGFLSFGVGFLLSALAAYLLLDSVIATTGNGLFSGFIRGRNGVGSGRSFGETTSMGIVFLPFMLGVVALFYDAGKKWAWWLTYIGLGVVAVEILSHLRFQMSVRTSHLLLMLGMFAAGVGLMLRSYKDTGKTLEAFAGETLENASSAGSNADTKTTSKEPKS